MTQIRANGIDIEYDTFGDRDNPALILIIGLGGQLIYWQDEFCSRLSDSGFFVVRFDNRDSGLSTLNRDLDLAQAQALSSDLLQGKPVQAPFSIEDMADDTVALMDGLEIDKAHICGMSMGGFIAQTICVNHPSRALSLTSIYSHSGSISEFMPEPRVIGTMMQPVRLERKAAIRGDLEFFRLTFGNRIEFDENFHRDVLSRGYDRAFHPVGVALQSLAILSQKDRTAALADLTIPALIIHGDADPLVPVSGGKKTARAIGSNARLKIIKGMGHVLPNLDAYWSEILDEMISFLRSDRD